MHINLPCFSLTGVHGRQQMHRRASQAARGGAAKRAKVSWFWGRCFMAWRRLQLLAIHPRSRGSGTMWPGSESQTGFVAPLEKWALCWKPGESGGQSSGTFLMEVILEQIYPDNGKEELMEMPIYWPCPLRAPIVSALPMTQRRKRQFFKLYPLLYGPLSISMELCPPLLKVIFPLSEQRGAGGWTEGELGLRVGEWMNDHWPSHLPGQDSPLEKEAMCKGMTLKSWVPCFVTAAVTRTSLQELTRSF